VGERVRGGKVLRLNPEVAVAREISPGRQVQVGASGCSPGWLGGV